MLIRLYAALRALRAESGWITIRSIDLRFIGRPIFNELIGPSSDCFLMFISSDCGPSEVPHFNWRV